MAWILFSRPNRFSNNHKTKSLPLSLSSFSLSFLLRHSSLRFFQCINLHCNILACIEAIQTVAKHPLKCTKANEAAHNKSHILFLIGMHNFQLKHANRVKSVSRKQFPIDFQFDWRIQNNNTKNTPNNGMKESYNGVNRMLDCISVEWAKLLTEIQRFHMNTWLLCIFFLIPFLLFL